MKLVVLGLSLSSSWGNGHATTFRALLKSFARRGHQVLFLERDVPWYASQRDLTDPDWCRLEFYEGLSALDRWRDEIAAADAVIVGSYVPEGVEVAASSTGTSVGAALLCLGAAPAPRTTARLVPDHAGALRDYAALWRRRVIPTRSCPAASR